MLFAEVRDVVALDAQRQVVQREGVAQTRQRRLARLERVRQARLLFLRRLGRVALGHLEQAALGPALGAAHLDPRSATGRQYGGELRGAALERHDHLAGDVDTVAVVAERELLDDLAGPAPGRVLDEEGLASDQRALAHPEHLHVPARLALPEAEHVERARPLAFDDLAFLDVTHGLEPVAQQGRLLELAGRGGAAHVLLDGASDIGQPSAQEVDDLIDHLEILVARHAIVAGSE